MSKLDKVLKSAAGNAAGDAANVEDVFSTYLYDGTGAAQTITNGIDLSTEGGMVWQKRRSSAGHNFVSDTERNPNSFIYTNLTSDEGIGTSGSSFNSDGFTIGAENNLHNTGDEVVSWTFRKAPRFFDVVTYTGNSTAGRTIAHDLGVAPGMIIVKCTNDTHYWAVYHKELGGTKTLYLNSTEASETSAGAWNNTDPTSSVFTVGTNNVTNSNSNSYVAYLFAHDPVGENDDGMIACGSYAGNMSGNAPQFINLGWEAQYVIVKKVNSTGDWGIADALRGMYNVAGEGVFNELQANLTAAENAGYYGFTADANGFGVSGSNYNNTSDTYIYMAIRAPMMKEPEAGTEVFAVDTSTTSHPAFTSGFPVDATLNRWDISASSSGFMSDRLRGGKRSHTDTTGAEITFDDIKYDLMTGMSERPSPTNLSTLVAWMFKRAKGFFDVVAYTTDGVNGRTLNHNLGTPPELAIFKSRTYAGSNWYAQCPDLFATNVELRLNTTGALSAGGVFTSPPTSTQMFVSSSNVNLSVFSNMICYLFATLAGVSKVGSYTGNGSNQNIACGFSAGARFVLIKRTDATGDWYTWDTTRGIIAGNDPHLSLNTTAAQVTTDDSIDPQSAGFTVNQVSATNINVSSATYIFLAIA